MTQLVEELTNRLAQLPEGQQDKYATQFLKELSEAKPAPKRHWVGGRKPTREEVKAAVEGLRRFQKGKTLGPDLTIREAIDEGRA